MVKIKKQEQKQDEEQTYVEISTDLSVLLSGFRVDVVVEVGFTTYFWPYASNPYSIGCVVVIVVDLKQVLKCVLGHLESPPTTVTVCFL